MEEFPSPKLQFQAVITSAEILKSENKTGEPAQLTIRFAEKSEDGGPIVLIKSSKIICFLQPLEFSISKLISK